MALFDYGFKRLSCPSDPRPVLPSPLGSLNKLVPSTSIVEANKEVSERIVKCKDGKKASYLKVTPEMKAKVGKYAAENGIVSAIRKFSQQFPPDSLKESTVRGWKQLYLRELQRLRREGKKMAHVKVLPMVKTGRLLLLGNELDKEVQAYLIGLRKVGGHVNSAVAIAAGRGIVRSRDSRLLAENGGGIVLSKGWAQLLMSRMGFVKRKACSTAKVTVENFEEMKIQFLFDIQVFVNMEEIPPDLIINWDHTGINYVPISKWTMEKEGTKRIEIAGVDDKRQFTAVFAGAMSGEFLPVQLIYQGKTKACLPKVKFPDGWDVTCSPTHWSNECLTKDYNLKILVPYVEDKRAKLKLSDNHRALAIADKFKGQCTPDVIALLETHNIDIIFVPPNCTDRLQPMDLSINKSAKDFLKQQFQLWYSNEVYLQKERSGQLEPISFPMTTMKPLGVDRVLQLHAGTSEDGSKWI